MRTVSRSAVISSILLLTSCGDGGGSAPSISPSPSPTSAPTPSPTSTTTPVAASLTYIHVFSVTPGDGSQPNGPLVEASDGNFYGTTRAGGANMCRDGLFPCGVIYRMRADGDVTVLYSFGANATDAYSPSGRLVQGRDGALYGVSASGGLYGGGTVFRVTMDGKYALLHSFGATPEDAIVPLGGLTEGADGSFYGVTASGGANRCPQIPQAGSNCGTIFRMSPSGAVTILHSFGASSTDGVTPSVPPIQASDGNFYGTTSNGGASDCAVPYRCGVAYKMTPAGEVTVIHFFGRTSEAPNAPVGLIQGTDGWIYGFSSSGGAGRCGGFYGCGTVFKMTTDGTVSVLYAFALEGRTAGDGPSGIIQARDGNIYGTTRNGGAFGGDGDGTVFRLTPNGQHTVLYSLGPNVKAPSAPNAGLIQARDGSFYGTTEYNGSFGAVGGRFGFGTAFRLVL